MYTTPTAELTADEERFIHRAHFLLTEFVFLGTLTEEEYEEMGVERVLELWGGPESDRILKKIRGGK